MNGFLETLKTKAAQFFEEPPADLIYSRKLSRDEIFRNRFRLPVPETLMSAVPAHVQVVYPQDLGHADTPANILEGNMFLSESFLVFESVDDPRALQFVVPLITIRRVERLPSRSSLFALRIQFYMEHAIIVQIQSMISTCERFCGLLRANLKSSLPLARQARLASTTFYSEFLIASYQEKLEIKAGKAAGNKHQPPPGGLGRTFGFPGDAVKLKDRNKTRLWLEYFLKYGRNICMLRQPQFYKLIRVGLPNRLRGELWEICAGSVHMRLASPKLYDSLLNEYKGRSSLAIEEIEKDLNRSLPEYSAYQSPEGIAALRRVLTVYSWKNPEVGYCQAMNIVAAALLIFQTEEQTFWTLNVLCDKLLPGYYSKTMYGTLLDQKVLEELVEKTMRVLSEHFAKCEVPMSVVSLPWFLSLFINSMPLVYAFRILDIFFLEGSRTLFQIALAILRVNGEELLKATDNTGVIEVLKNYFDTLDHSAHPHARSARTRAITRFQELLVVAFREFSMITDEMIHQYRAKNEASILENIETFAKRTQLRNLPKQQNLQPAQCGVIYDKFYCALQEDRPGRGGQESDLVLHQFIAFMSSVSTWMNPNYTNISTLETHPFVRKLFGAWDRRARGTLSLADVVAGMDNLMNHDMMELMNYFFHLYDPMDTGVLDRNAVVAMSEAFLLMMRPYSHGDVILDALSREQLGLQPQVPEGRKAWMIKRETLIQQQTIRYLSSVSRFLRLAFNAGHFEHDQAPRDVSEVNDLIQTAEEEHKETTDDKKVLANYSEQGLTLPAFRMAVLADETLELFFAQTLRETLILEETGGDLQRAPWRSIIGSIINDGARMANSVRRRIDELDRRTDEADDLEAHPEDHALLDI